MLVSAQYQARQRFEEARYLREGSDEGKKGVQEAEDVARILRENVVQGEGNNEDRFSTWQELHVDNADGS